MPINLSTMNACAALAQSTLFMFKISETLIGLIPNDTSISSNVNYVTKYAKNEAFLTLTVLTQAKTLMTSHVRPYFHNTTLVKDFNGVDSRLFNQLNHNSSVHI